MTNTICSYKITIDIIIFGSNLYIGRIPKVNKYYVFYTTCLIYIRYLFPFDSMFHLLNYELLFVSRYSKQTFKLNIILIIVYLICDDLKSHYTIYGPRFELGYPKIKCGSKQFYTLIAFAK